MITCETSSVAGAAKQAFLTLYNQANVNSDDSALLYEETAALLVTNPEGSQPAFTFDKQGRFRYMADYTLSILGIDQSLIGLEEEHYSDVLGKGQLDMVAENLSRYPATRRSVVSIWSPGHADPKRAAAPCLTYLYFRRHNDQLEVHSHFRANDAYRLLLLDMQMGVSIQHEIASRLNVPAGRYMHFTDSLHFYKQDQSKINAQREYFLHSPHWKGVI